MKILINNPFFSLLGGTIERVCYFNILKQWKMNGYDLSRKFVDFSFENPSKIKPNHYALYFFSIEHCNRLGWKKEFGLPTTMTMEAIGIKSYNTYINTFNELVDFGFIKVIQRSKNQYSANIIELSNFNKALDKALDKAFIKHATKQSESTKQSIIESNDSIDKPITNNKLNKETSKPINQLLLSEVKTSDVVDSQVVYFQIAKAYQALFIKNLKEKNAPTKNQENAKYKSYVDPIRLMLTSDGVTKEQLTKVFKFLGSPEGEFWKPNILSTKKLREKFEQLIIKSQSQNGGKQETRTNQQIATDAFNSETAKQFRFR